MPNQRDAHHDVRTERKTYHAMMAAKQLNPIKITIGMHVNIKINLIKENIEMYNDTLLLYHNKNLVAIIPLY